METECLRGKVLNDFSGAIFLPFGSEKVFKSIRYGLPGNG
ncbi:hypothetical protein HMPREF1326_01912 [Akkermansia sp. KLE1605]|nr:hypothetical protein HMPREF1326_01912 [Akkermansia sp. KLE1605]